MYPAYTEGVTKEVSMVNYGENYDDEAPSSTHIKRAERKYSLHKLAQAVGRARFLRNHGGESTKRR